MSSLAAVSKLEVGSPFPDGDVVILTDKGREKVKMSSLLSGKDVIIFIPAAFTKVCSEKHLPSFANEKWMTSGYKIHCISTDTINVLHRWRTDIWWGRKDSVVPLFTDHVNMVSNCLRNVATELLFNDPTLGNIFQRSVAVVEDGVIKKLAIEIVNSECKLTHGNQILEALSH